MVKDFSIKVKCPMCGQILNVTKERRESFNCYYCNAPLVFKDGFAFRTLLPKGEPIEIDERLVL